MFDVFYSGTKPNVFPHEQLASDIDHARTLSRTRYFWWINYLADYTDFDFLWEPVSWEKDFTHTWSSQHHQYSGTYLVPTHVTEVQYRFHQHIIPTRRLINDPHYVELVPNIEFDYTWHPHPWDPPYIYVFGNQWYPATKMPTVEYHVPGANEYKFMQSPLAKLPQKYHCQWQVLTECHWDFSWVPDPGDPPYIYVFGNQWHRAEIMPTVEYCVPGAMERKFMTWPRAELLPDYSQWSVPDTVDVGEVDFSWVPDPGSPPYIYQFATQHQKTGGPVYSMPGATEIKYIDQVRIKTSRVAAWTYVIDHLDNNAQITIDQVNQNVSIVRYFDNYLDTLKRIARGANRDGHEFVWICSSVCDYSNFDFTWHPEQWQAGMLHVFASDGEKFGDTFFMHSPTFLSRSENCKLLEWYDLNFVGISVPRRPMPIISHNSDTHVEQIKTRSWTGPLALFTVNDYDNFVPTVPLWREQTKTVVPLDSGAETVIVPRAAIPYVKTQVYDYPYIDRSQRICKATPSDIVFISNGEPMAEENWKNLLSICPHALRSDGVTGRELAYKTAAALSSTPWFFAVFAKTEVLPEFKFDFAPDRLQQPKHYIFHSRNPLNGLEYGAMNINLYNKQLVLDTVPGLDFTLSAAHEVVPICASISRFNTDPWITWRSAFREVLKLKQEVDQGAGTEIQYRLKVWCSRAQGQNAEYCLQGAGDAVEYYEQVNGDYSALKLSFDWEWLENYYYNKYNTKIW